jgi:hypothetical protein
MRKVELEVLNGFRSRVFFKLSSISSNEQGAMFTCIN